MYRLILSFVFLFSATGYADQFAIPMGDGVWSGLQQRVEVLNKDFLVSPEISPVPGLRKKSSGFLAHEQLDLLEGVLDDVLVIRPGAIELFRCVHPACR